MWNEHSDSQDQIQTAMRSPNLPSDDQETTLRPQRDFSFFLGQSSHKSYSPRQDERYGWFLNLRFYCRLPFILLLCFLIWNSIWVGNERSVDSLLVCSVMFYCFELWLMRREVWLEWTLSFGGFYVCILRPLVCSGGF